MDKNKQSRACPRCGKSVSHLMPATHSRFKFVCEDCVLEIEGVFFATGPAKPTLQCPRGHPIPKAMQRRWWIHCPTCTAAASLELPTEEVSQQAEEVSVPAPEVSLSAPASRQALQFSLFDLETVP